MKQIILSLLCISLGWTAWGQTQVSTLNITRIGGLNYAGRSANDIWGYADDDSAATEYAIVGTNVGTSIVSLANPAQPSEVQFIPGVRTIWRDIKTYQDYAYVSNEGGNGILIIDLENLPGLCVSKDTMIGGINTSHNLWVDEKAGFLFVCGYDFTGGFQIFDLKPDPWNPVHVGTYNLRYVHDLYTRNGLAYSSEIEDFQLAILAIDDSANWQVLGTKSYPGAFTHNAWLNDAGNVCFTTDEYGGAFVSSWDVSDPTDIKALDAIRSPLSNFTATPHNVHVKNDLLYISYYTDGLVVIDAAIPDQMVTVGYYDTSPSFSGGGFQGQWGAYPFLPSGLILSSDQETGLHVFTFDGPRANQVYLTAVDTFTNQPLFNTFVDAGSLGQTFTDSQGTTRYAYLEDSIDVQLNASLYLPKTVTIKQTPGTRLDTIVKLLPQPTGVVIVKASDAIGTPLRDVRIETRSTLNNLSARTIANGLAGLSPLQFVSYPSVLGKWGYVTDTFTVTPVAGTVDTVKKELTAGYLDPFALDLGWQTVSSVSAGEWTIATPKGTQRAGSPFNPDTDIAGDIGSGALMTGNDASAQNGDALSQGFTTISSPPFKVEDIPFAQLTFQYWLVHTDDNGVVPVQSSALIVELYDGQQSIPLWSSSSVNQANWTKVDTIDVFGYFPDNALLSIRITANNNTANTLLEAGIDEFHLFESADPTSVELETQLAQTSLRALPSSPGAEPTFAYKTIEHVQTYLEVYNMQGKQLANVPLMDPNGQVSLPLSLPAGAYIARLMVGGQLATQTKWQQP